MYQLPNMISHYVLKILLYRSENSVEKMDIFNLLKA